MSKCSIRLLGYFDNVFAIWPENITLSLTYEADEMTQSHSHSFLGIWAFDSQDVLSICFLEQESIPLLKKSWNPHLHRDLSVSPQRYVNSKQKSTWKTPPFRLEEREFSSKINKRSQYITFSSTSVNLCGKLYDLNENGNKRVEWIKWSWREFDNKKLAK